MSTIYRRDRIYWARAQRGNQEFRRSLKTANRAIAEKRFRQWLDELDASAWGTKPRYAFNEAAQRFVREHLTTLKPSGAKRYGVSLKALSLHFGGKGLVDITKAELSAFETQRRQDGVSSGTIRRDLSCLSSMLESATDWEWIEDGSNPVPSFMRRRAKRGLKEANPRTRYLTMDEEDRLLDEASPAVREAIILAIDSGLRSNEMFGLKWSQVDLVRGLITTTTRTKSGHDRKVPVGRRSAQILAQMPRQIDSPFVLNNPDTGTRYVHMLKGIKAAARRAKIENLIWHDLRRTAGCRWLQRDRRTMDEVSTLLGHSSVEVTEQRYAFLISEDIAESLSTGTKPAHKTAHRA